MAQATVIQPDTAFLRRVMAAGGGDLKKCYQCATCSVACELSDEEVSFPRRQMLEAQWGLKDRLMADPAIWLCHNCGKCTDLCPRGARPGDVMGAVRSEAIRHFAFPGILGRIAADVRALPLLFLLPALVLAAVVFWAPKPEPVDALEFAALFPIPVMEALFFTVSGLALIAFAGGMVRYARALKEGGAPVGETLPPALLEIASHRRFSRCDDSGMRSGHLLTFWGFMGLALVGTAAGVGSMTGLLRTPMPLWHPIKLFANASAAVALAGVVLLLLHRIRKRGIRSGAYFDWFFLGTLSGVLLTGIVAQILRLTQLTAMYAVYFVHLVLVFGLLLYAPYSKFAHLAYRTLALASSTNSYRRG